MTYKNYEVNRVVDVNPHKKVLNVLRKRCRKNAHILGLLFFDWPASNEVIKQLCCFITDGIKSEKEPVLYPIIESALKSYSETVFHNRDTKIEDPARLSAFVEKLISETSKALEIEITDQAGDSWCVEDGEAFADWVADHTGDLNVTSKLYGDECSIRKALYQLVTNESVKNVLRRTDYEKTAMVGGLAFGY